MLLSHMLILSLVCVTINGRVHRTFTCSRNPDVTTTNPTTKAETKTMTDGTSTTGQAKITPNNDNGKCSNKGIVNGRLPNCTAIYIAGCQKSGIYNITPNTWAEGPFEAYCDMKKLNVQNRTLCNGRGWTVFQRRVNGSVDFNRNWTSYKEGFGQLNHEFWLGNEKLHNLTQPGKYRLRIDLVGSNGTRYHACYKKFHIKEEGVMYELHASGFRGNNSLSDGLSDQNGKAFSTSDRDNTNSTNICADIIQGGWWHEACDGDYTNLNGVYGSNQDSTSIYWNGLPNGESIISSEMKIRYCIGCS
ncbi:ficolin-1-A-like [Apostichopus japonicus]|uniref:ficolin-1-A-like n=1 Tax=Stichopus japonicus TaxID=307972 RepID=UPI003AB3708D